MTKTKKRNQLSGPKDGFALVISLTLMAFLLLLALSMATLLTIETRVAGMAQQREKARQNALLGMKSALADLQKYAGPDRRITGRGHTMALAAGGNALLDRSNPQALWTGVAVAGNVNGPGFPDFPDEPGKRVHWLISGLDETTMEFSGDTVAFYTEGSYRVSVPDAGDANTTTEIEGPTIEAGWVDADDTGGNQFAFFVEDEGVKGALRTQASLNEDGAFTEGSLLPGTMARLERLGPLEDFEDAGGRLPRAQQLGDLGLMGVQSPSSRRFDYTLGSLGVLSNPRLGGLREDLSTAFEDEAAFASVFNEGDRMVIDRDRLDAAPDLDQNDYISWKIFRDYYALKDRVNADGGTLAASMLIRRSPTFFPQRLADRVETNSPGLFSTTGPHARPRYDEREMTHYVFVDNQRSDNAPRTYNPLKPVLAYVFFRVWLEVNEVSGEDEDPRYEGRAFMQPFFGYYNPYNVRLDTAELNLRQSINIAVRITDRNGRVVESGRDRDGWHMIWRPRTGGGDETNVRFFSKEENYSIPPGGVVVHSVTGDIEMESEEVFQYQLTDTFGSIQRAGYFSEWTFEEGPYEPPFTAEVETSYPQADNRYRMLSLTSGAGVSRAHKAPHDQPYQLFAQPIAYEMVDNWGSGPVHGKRLVIEDVEPGESPAAAYSNAVDFGMWLQTTNESVNGIRPLIDANIRAAFVDPRWDVDPSGGSARGLGLRTPAGWTGAPRGLNNRGTIDRNVMGLGHNLWGIYDAGRYGFSGAGGGFPRLDDNGGQMSGVWGRDHHSLGVPRLALFDVPREPLVSLGQLQHAEAGHFSYEPSYIVGNSYANPRIPLDDWRHENARDTFSDWHGGWDKWRIDQPFNLYDASYLVNEVLWDDFTFTTLPFGVGDAEYQAILRGDQALPNPRYRPYEPADFRFDAASLSGNGDDGVRRNAGFVLVDGAFNVNSTSVEAWEAFLSSTAGLPLARLDDQGRIVENNPWEPQGARFPRMKHSPAGSGDFWQGFEELDPVQVRELAVAAVREVEDRGPFRSLGEFVNRWNPAYDRRAGNPGSEAVPADDPRRRSGALQAALDNSVNRGLNSRPESEEISADFLSEAAPDNAPQATGFPGHMLQGDILQALAPYMQVRSDTFTIRAVGRVRNPLTDQTEAEAWCEAVVQRVPDPFPDDEQTATEALVRPESPFGRKFKIISFRWIEDASL